MFRLALRQEIALISLRARPWRPRKYRTIIVATTDATYYKNIKARSPERIIGVYNGKDRGALLATLLKDMNDAAARVD